MSAHRLLSHTMVATLLLLPFSRGLEKLAYLSIQETEEEKQQKEMGTLLDERFLEQPAFAMERCKKVAMTMAQTAKQGFFDAMSLLDEYDEKTARKVYQKEEEVDHYEDELGSYLVKLSSKNLSQHDAETLSMILHSISDFERISDHAMNIEESARKIKEKEIVFSDKAKEELKVFEKIIQDILNLSVTVFLEEDSEQAREIEPMEEVVDRLTKKVKKRHIKRLEKGKCTMDAGLVLNDLVTNFERVADHCSNIGVCVIQSEEEAFDTHEYLDTLDKGKDSRFNARYEVYKQKYMLP